MVLKVRPIFIQDCVFHFHERIRRRKIKKQNEKIHFDTGPTPLVMMENFLNNFIRIVTRKWN